MSRDEVSKIIEIGHTLQTETISAMNRGNIINKVSESYSDLRVHLIPVSGNYGWDFSGSSKGVSLMKRWEQWFVNVESLFNENPDRSAYRVFKSMHNQIAAGWKEYNLDKTMAIKSYETNFLKLNEYLNNVLACTPSGEIDIGINANEANVAAHAQNTATIDEVDNFLRDVKNKIESKELEVVDDNYIRIVDDALDSKNPTKYKKALKLFKKSVNVVEPGLQVIVDAANILVSFL